MVDMPEGHELKEIHDGLKDVWKQVEDLTNTVRYLQEQLHTIDGSQTKVTDHAEAE